MSPKVQAKALSATSTLNGSVATRSLRRAGTPSVTAPRRMRSCSKCPTSPSCGSRTTTGSKRWTRITDMSENAKSAIFDLMVANRILANEGVVDAFGHISVRNPDNAARYFLACSRSPGLVTEEDIIEFELDSNRLDNTDRAIYAERFIHGCIYKARTDVMSVCHSHAHAVVPFTVTNAAIEPIWVMAAGSGLNVPNWDIRDEFPNEGTMLVVNDATGRSLAKKLAAGRVCLLRGHGAVIATSELKATVMVSIGLMCNAAMLIQAHTLSQGRGDAAVKHLSPAEIESTSKILLGPLGLDRAWEYWRVRAGFPAKDE